MTRSLQFLLLHAVAIAAAAVVSEIGAAQDFEREPISYSKSQPKNRVSDLIDDLGAGRRSLKHEPHFGYLRALLAELQVPQLSQMLVFSKTSLQRHRISPGT